jgi:mRNA interferase HigB
VRIIKESFLLEMARKHPNASPYLEGWRKAVRSARWRNLVDVRRLYASADNVKVASGRVVVVFNAGGNNYRLIAALHYNRQIVFVLRFLTHAEYSKDHWKNEL